MHDHLTDLSSPAAWYPAARQQSRAIIAHLGPTNSGKTHAALQALRGAPSGVYCGPLRLLAWEVFERLNTDGPPCSLVTGQELQPAPAAAHTSCTVEMADLSEPVEVGVIDEIQMLGDPARGWSFTRALLGLQAREVHVCGDPAAEALLRHLAASCGDTFRVVRYQRLRPLEPEGAAVNSVQQVRPGDCVIAFSRREIFQLKRSIEKRTAHKCCVVYGALPPRARSSQAALFNRRGSGYDVLVASDAVGMGLNLAVRRIVLTKLEKFDGTATRQLSVSELKQIAGRAGRAGGRHARGKVAVMRGEDVAFMRAALQQPSTQLRQAFLLPRYEQLALYALHYPEGGLPGALRSFERHARLSNEFDLGDLEGMHAVATLLRHLPLSLEECYLFCLSPCQTDSPAMTTALLDMATAYVDEGRVLAERIEHPPLQPPGCEADLCALEATHKTYELYVWLSYRFEEAFVEREAAQKQLETCAELIENGLARLTGLNQAGNGELDSVLASIALRDTMDEAGGARTLRRRLLKRRARMLAPYAYLEGPPASRL